MNSLHTLNGRGEESVSYTDNRPDGPIFSRSTASDRTKTIEQNDDHGAVYGINVLDIVNPSAVNMYYEIDVSSLSGTTVTWNTIPSGCVVSNPSTGVYKITGINSGAIWKTVRSPVVDIPDSFIGTFTYTGTLYYTNTITGVTETQSWTVTVTVTDVVVLTTPVEQFFVPGETQTITAPTISTDKLGTYTVTVTPTTIGDIDTMQPTIADPLSVTSFNGTTKVFTIEGTRAQVVEYLAAFSATFTTSATDNTFTYDLTCTNTDVPNDSEAQTVTQAVYWFPPGTAEYGTGASTLANPGRIINLNDPHQLYTIEITPTDAAQISNLEFQDIDYWTRAAGDTIANQSTNPLYTNYSADISDSGRLVMAMREDPSGVVDACEFNVYQYDLDTNALAHIETISLNTEPGTFDINISKDGTYVIHGDLDANDAYRYTWNGSTYGTGTALGKYATTIDQSNDGSVAVFTNYDNATAFSSLETYLYYDSGSGFALQQTIANPEATDGAGFGFDIAISGDGQYVAVSDPLYDVTTGTPYTYEGRVYIYERTGGTTLTLQQTLTGVAYETFGMTVELNSDGSELYIGAPGYSSGTKPHSGKVYVYSRTGTSWTQDAALVSPLTNGSQFGGVHWTNMVGNPWIEIKIDTNDTILTVPNDGGSAAVFKKVNSAWTAVDVIDTFRAYTMKSGDTIYDNVLFDSDGTNIYWFKRQFGSIGTWDGTTLTANNLPKFPINRAIDGIVLTSVPTIEDIELTYEITLEDASTHSSTQTVTHNEGIA